MRLRCWWKIGREERALGLFVTDLLEDMALTDSAGRDRGWAGIDCLEQTFQIRERCERIVRPLSTREARSSQPQAEMSAIV